MLKEKLKEYRKINLLTQKEMAEKLEISRETYIRLEKGANYSIKTLKKISELLSLNKDELLNL